MRAKTAGVIANSGLKSTKNPQASVGHRIGGKSPEAKNLPYQESADTNHHIIRTNWTIKLFEELKNSSFLASFRPTMLTARLLTVPALPVLCSAVSRRCTRRWGLTRRWSSIAPSLSWRPRRWPLCWNGPRRPGNEPASSRTAGEAFSFWPNVQEIWNYVLETRRCQTASYVAWRRLETQKQGSSVHCNKMTPAHLGRFCNITN